MSARSRGSQDGIDPAADDSNASPVTENSLTTPKEGSWASFDASEGTDFFELAKPPKQRKFKSARLRGEYEKPWTENKDPRVKYDRIIFWSFASLGLAIGFYLIYDGWKSVDNPSYCVIFEDDFSSGINTDDWSYEIQVGGFGTGSFDWTTDDPANSYTDSVGLHIVPTITANATNLTMAEITNGYNLNLTSQGVCTSGALADCVVQSNATLGKVINPVRSARLNTRGKHNITYGKVEVVAKLPKGSWLWPAIWMMPENNTYGAWPASGEIDLLESKGNNRDNYAAGRNVVSGTLHWAPAAILDAFWRSSGERSLKRQDYSDSFHTYAVEWSEDYIFTWVDSRIMQSLYYPFGKRYGTMWERGNFDNTLVNGSTPVDPWSSTGRFNTPFDEAFYLILNVAVGGTNGYFKDGQGSKPWVDGSATAAEQFLEGQSAWEPTWGEGDSRGMTVKSVKMFNPGACST